MFLKDVEPGRQVLIRGTNTRMYYIDTYKRGKRNLSVLYGYDKLGILDRSREFWCQPDTVVTVIEVQ